MIVYKFFKILWVHLKYSKILKKVYKDENLIQNLSNLFGVNFRIDWIGRIYAVINPTISNGEYDSNTIIYEYDENGLRSDAFVEHRIIDKMKIASNFIKAKNLFDLLTYKIKKIDNYDNYLFIIQPITLEELIKRTKYFSGLIAMVLLIVAIYFMFF
jgi:hypothetical protein